MKLIKNIVTTTVAIALLILSACEPIEDRELLRNSFDPDQIQLEVIQTAGGKGNGLTLKMNTPGVIGYWDYLIDRKYTDVVNNIVFPIPGTHTFKYVVATPYLNGGNPADREVIVKTIEVTIEELDQELPGAYYDLIGENLEGKTWVFDGAGGDGEQWWFMSDPNNPWGLWWNAGGTCCPPGDVGGKMTFDLEGAANYTYFNDAGGAGSLGTFSFNGDYTKIFIGGGLNILGAGSNGSGNNNGEYKIVELSADRMVLHTDTNDAGTGWTWIFIPE